jgi:hypothetical protein
MMKSFITSNSLPSVIRMIKSRRMRWAGHETHRVLVVKPEGKRPAGRTRRMWVDNITIDLKRDRMGWYGLD